MKMKVPQYVLTSINLLEYRTNSLLNDFDILCFTSILYIFLVADVLTVKSIFSGTN